VNRVILLVTYTLTPNPSPLKGEGNRLRLLAFTSPLEGEVTRSAGEGYKQPSNVSAAK